MIERPYAHDVLYESLQVEAIGTAYQGPSLYSRYATHDTTIWSRIFLYEGNMRLAVQHDLRSQGCQCIVQPWNGQTLPDAGAAADNQSAGRSDARSASLDVAQHRRV